MWPSIVIFLVVLVVFPLFWSSIFVLLAQSGWAAIAKHHACTTQPPGTTYPRCSAYINSRTRYKRCLSVTLGNQGIYIEPSIFFRVAHPPLLIPFSCVTGLAPGEPAFGNTIRVDISAAGHDIKLYVPVECRPFLDLHKYPWKPVFATQSHIGVEGVLN